jgi:hypothetical protein
MNSRLLVLAVAALLLFGAWTSVTRYGISHGSRESAWIDRRFGDWPEEVQDVFATFDIQLSIFATYASTKATSEEPGAIPDLFGRPVIGTTVDGDDSQNIYGSRFTTGIRAGRLASISVFVAAPVDEPPHDQFQLAIYGDSRGVPGRRLATTESGRLVPDAWNTLPISAEVAPRTSYWLMYNSNGTNVAVNNTTYTAVAGNPIDLAIRSHQPARPSLLADRLTAPADMRPMVAGIVLTAGLFAATGRPRAGIVLLVGFVLALLAAGAVRAHLFDPYSYPSGHALRSTYVAIAFCFAVPSRFVRLAAGLFVVVVSLASVHTGGHYTEEVLGGVLLAWTIAFAAMAFGGKGTRAVHPNPGLDTASVIDLTDGTSGQVVMEGKSE